MLEDDDAELQSALRASLEEARANEMAMIHVRAR